MRKSNIKVSVCMINFAIYRTCGRHNCFYWDEYIGFHILYLTILSDAVRAGTSTGAAVRAGSPAVSLSISYGLRFPPARGCFESVSRRFNATISVGCIECPLGDRAEFSVTARESDITLVTHKKRPEDDASDNVTWSRPTRWWTPRRSSEPKS